MILQRNVQITSSLIIFNFLPESVQMYSCLCCISNCYFNLYTRLDVDRGDLLHNLRWAVEINYPLVDPHLELVPGLGTFSTRGLTGGDTQGLGWHAHRSLHLQLLVLGSTDQVSTDLLQRLDIS